MFIFINDPLEFGFEPRKGQFKHYNISICCLSTKHAALRSKSSIKVRNQDNVYEWSSMYTCGLSLQ